MKNLILTISICLNIVLAMTTVLAHSFYWKVPPRFGVLKEDVQIGQWSASSENNKQPVFTLPKGLTVKDVSDYNQFDQFEPHRFSITITSEGDLVDYDAELTNPHKSMYTADGWDLK